MGPFSYYLLKDKLMVKNATTDFLDENRSDSVASYLIMRTDLPSLGRGKALAQAMHAGNHLTHHLMFLPLKEGRDIDTRVIKWHEQGEGFGTTLAIGEHSIDKRMLNEISSAARACGHFSGIVEDTSYPYHVDEELISLIDPDHHALPPQKIKNGWRCFRREDTSCWVLGNKEDLSILMRQFNLVPND